MEPAPAARIRLRFGHQLARSVGAGAMLLFGLFLLGSVPLWLGPSVLRLVAEQDAWQRGTPVTGTTTRWRVRSQKGLLNTHEVEVQVALAGRLPQKWKFEFRTLFVRAARIEQPELRPHPERADVIAFGPAMEVLGWQWAADGLLLAGLLLGGGACSWGALAMLRELLRARRTALVGQPVLLEVTGKTPPAGKRKEWTWHLRAPDGAVANASYRLPRTPLWVERDRIALGLHIAGSGQPPLVVRDDLHPLALSGAARDALLETLRGG